MTSNKNKDDSVEFRESMKAKDPGFWRDIWQQARLVVALLRDPKVPFYLKFVPFLAIVYLFVPIDLVPDVLIGLGQLDDVTILLVGSKIFIELSPAHVVAHHLDIIREQDGFLVQNEK
ncbi:MAG: DUF1232 domain-containing protein, partial [Chloroflexota bacterium]